MVDGTLVVGLFVLACTLQDIDPRTGAPVAQPHPASLVARDGTGAFTGWQEVDGQNRVSVRKMPDGAVVMSGLRLRKSGEETWAELRPLEKTNRFRMRWLVNQSDSGDGQRRVAIWSEGECDHLARDKGKR